MNFLKSPIFVGILVAVLVYIYLLYSGDMFFGLGPLTFSIIVGVIFMIIIWMYKKYTHNAGIEDIHIEYE
jgi:hypothetical protein